MCFPAATQRIDHLELVEIKNQFDIRTVEEAGLPWVWEFPWGFCSHGMGICFHLWEFPWDFFQI